MALDSPVQVVLDLERSAQTITGQITIVGAGTTSFFGWLELIDQLDHAIDDQGDRSDGERIGS